MRKTTRTKLDNKRFVNIEELQSIYSLGKAKLDSIGVQAGAVIRIGRSKLYNLEKIQVYFENQGE